MYLDNQTENDVNKNEPGTDSIWYAQTHKAYLSMVNSFDKAVLTLSGGALALSIAFIRDIAPNMNSKNWLIASWLCFGVSILFILFSFITSQIDCYRALEAGDKTGKASRLTWFWNYSATLLFTSGVIFLSVFAWYNL